MKKVENKVSLPRANRRLNFDLVLVFSKSLASTQLEIYIEYNVDILINQIQERQMS